MISVACSASSIPASSAPGARAHGAASHSENYNPFQHSSKTNKEQYNAKLFQPLNSNGDFFSIAGNYNVGRNRNFSSIPLRIDTTQSATNSAPRVVGSASSNRFPIAKGEREYIILPCTTDAPQTGVADVPNTCGTLFDQSFNPSNTGNIRINSRFTLAPGLILTVDPSYQYVRANGGTGAVKANEGLYSRAASGSTRAVTPIFGYIGGQAYFGGVDLNGDGDTIDTPGRNGATSALTNTTQGVELYAPSLTRTHRYGLIANLSYEISPDQNVRVNFAHDYGRHRQTGEVTLLGTDGLTTEYFPIDAPLLDAGGGIMEKRNRKSFAILDQLSGEYRGKFFDRLTVNAGLTQKWFKRDLNNFCVTEAGGAFVDCFNNPTSQATFLAANPTYVPPTRRIFKFSKLLPSAGFTFELADRTSLYGSYSKGIQVPGTDNLYQSLGFAPGTATPKPETTDNFDLGLRYRSSTIQAQLGGWYTNFKNRLASSYDPVLDVTLYRNLGVVHKYGVDASIAYSPVPQITAYAFASYLKSKILDNVQTGECTAANVTAGASTGIGTCAAVGDPIFALTKGKREGGAPVYTVGGRLEGRVGPVQLGIQAKRTGSRYVNDQNLPIQPTAGYIVYPAKTPEYLLVDLDARIGLEKVGMGSKTYIQLNLTNLFDKLYVSGFTSNTATTSIPFAYVGTPRTFSASLNLEF